MQATAAPTTVLASACGMIDVPAVRSPSPRGGDSDGTDTNCALHQASGSVPRASTGLEPAANSSGKKQGGGSHGRKNKDKNGATRPHTKKGAWSEVEEMTLALNHREVGNKWAAISKFLPARSDNDVKNHWNSTLRSKSATKHRTFLWLYAKEVESVADNEAMRRSCFEAAQKRYMSLNEMSQTTSGDFNAAYEQAVMQQAQMGGAAQFVSTVRGGAHPAGAARSHKAARKATPPSDILEDTASEDDTTTEEEEGVAGEDSETPSDVSSDGGCRPSCVSSMGLVRRSRSGRLVRPSVRLDGTVLAAQPGSTGSGVARGSGGEEEGEEEALVMPRQPSAMLGAAGMSGMGGGMGCGPIQAGMMGGFPQGGAPAMASLAQQQHYQQLVQQQVQQQQQLQYQQLLQAQQQSNLAANMLLAQQQQQQFQQLLQAQQAQQLQIAKRAAAAVGLRGQGMSLMDEIARNSLCPSPALLPNNGLEEAMALDMLMEVEPPTFEELDPGLNGGLCPINTSLPAAAPAATGTATATGNRCSNSASCMGAETPLSKPMANNQGMGCFMPTQATTNPDLYMLGSQPAQQQQAMGMLMQQQQQQQEAMMRQYCMQQQQQQQAHAQRSCMGSAGPGALPELGSNLPTLSNFMSREMGLPNGNSCAAGTGEGAAQSSVQAQAQAHPHVRTRPVQRQESSTCLVPRSVRRRPSLLGVGASTQAAAAGGSAGGAAGWGCQLPPPAMLNTRMDNGAVGEGGPNLLHCGALPPLPDGLTEAALPSSAQTHTSGHAASPFRGPAGEAYPGCGAHVSTGAEPIPLGQDRRGSNTSGTTSVPKAPSAGLSPTAAAAAAAAEAAAQAALASSAPPRVIIHKLPPNSKWNTATAGAKGGNSGAKAQGGSQGGSQGRRESSTGPAGSASGSRSAAAAAAAGRKRPLGGEDSSEEEQQPQRRRSSPNGTVAVKQEQQEVNAVNNGGSNQAGPVMALRPQRATRSPPRLPSLLGTSSGAPPAREASPALEGVAPGGAQAGLMQPLPSLGQMLGAPGGGGMTHGLGSTLSLDALQFEGLTGAGNLPALGGSSILLPSCENLLLTHGAGGSGAEGMLLNGRAGDDLGMGLVF